MMVRGRLFEHIIFIIIIIRIIIIIISRKRKQKQHAETHTYTHKHEVPERNSKTESREKGGIRREITNLRYLDFSDISMQQVFRHHLDFYVLLELLLLLLSWLL